MRLPRVWLGCLWYDGWAEISICTPLVLEFLWKLRKSVPRFWLWYQSPIPRLLDIRLQATQQDRFIGPLPSQQGANLPKKSHWQDSQVCHTRIHRGSSQEMNSLTSRWLCKCLTNCKHDRLHKGWLYTLRRTSLRDSLGETPIQIHESKRIPKGL